MSRFNKALSAGLGVLFLAFTAHASYPVLNTVFLDTFSEAGHAVTPGSGINANWTPSPGAGGRWEVSTGEAPSGAGISDFINGFGGPYFGAQYVSSVTLGTSVTNWLVTIDIQDTQLGAYPDTSAGQIGLLVNWNGDSSGIGGSGAGATGLGLVVNPSFAGGPTLGGGFKTLTLYEVTNGVQSVLWTQALPPGSDGLDEGVWHTLAIARDGIQVQASGLGYTSSWFTTSIANTGYAGQAYGYIYAFSGKEGLAFDNFSIFEIPEPSAVVLTLGFALALWLRRSR